MISPTRLIERWTPRVVKVRVRIESLQRGTHYSRLLGMVRLVGAAAASRT